MESRVFSNSTQFFLLYKTLFLKTKTIVGNSYTLLNPQKRIIEDVISNFNIRMIAIHTHNCWATLT